ncbi:hypothetical protein L1887_05643 [Cichorium endivia]|nr:hypothetical protein L1887_05643 [Cichorium endivia]
MGILCLIKSNSDTFQCAIWPSNKRILVIPKEEKTPSANPYKKTQMLAGDRSSRTLSDKQLLRLHDLVAPDPVPFLTPN